MGTLETIGSWDAVAALKAALKAALDSVSPDSKVLVLVVQADNSTFSMAANVSNAEVVYMMEQKKNEIFNSFEE